jgi:hypothetical protein
VRLLLLGYVDVVAQMIDFSLHASNVGFVALAHVIMAISLFFIFCMNARWTIDVHRLILNSASQRLPLTYH